MKWWGWLLLGVVGLGVVSALAQWLDPPTELQWALKEKRNPPPVAAEILAAADHAGYEDGWIVGKADAWDGRPRDGEKARRLGQVHGQRYARDEEQRAFASGYHRGYNEGYAATRAVKGR